MTEFFDIETPPPARRERVRLWLAQLAARVLIAWDALRFHPRRRLIASVSAALVAAAAVGGVSAALASFEDHTPAVARRTVSDLSAAGFAAHIAGMDRAMLAMAARFDNPGRFGAVAAPATDAQGAAALTALTPATAQSSSGSPVFRWQALDADQARLINASVPVSSMPNAAARPFRLVTESAIEHMRALDCLSAAVYYEAAREGDAGQLAVAQVVLNRLRHEAYPKTICGVVFEGSERTTGCQFSFTCDGSLSRKPDPALWARAVKVASAALNGAVMKGVGNATHYHAVYVVPYWMPSLVKVATVGAHAFYRWEGGWGQPGAFRERYAGFEMDGMPNTDLAFLTPIKTEVIKPPEPEAPPPAVVHVLEAPASAVAPEGLIAPVIAQVHTAPPAPVMPDAFAPRNAPRTNQRLAIPGAISH